MKHRNLKTKRPDRTDDLLHLKPDSPNIKSSALKDRPM